MSRNFLKATGAMSIRQSNNYVWSVTELVGQGATGNVFVCRNKVIVEILIVISVNYVSIFLVFFMSKLNDNVVVFNIHIFMKVQSNGSDAIIKC